MGSRKGVLEGQQFQVLLAAEAIIAVTLGIGMMSYVNTSIVFSATDAVARDLALTLSAAVSPPATHTLTVNYQPNTSKYRINVAPDHVTVRGPQTAGKTKILQGPRALEPARAIRYTPSFLIRSTGSTVSISDSSAQLNDYCNVLPDKLSKHAIAVLSRKRYSPPPFHHVLEQTINGLDGVTNTTIQNATIHIVLVEVNDASFTVKHAPQSDSYKGIACHIAARVGATHPDAFPDGTNFVRESNIDRQESAIVIRYANQSQRSSLTDQDLATTIVEAIQP